MSRYGWVAAWLIAGLFHAIAAIGGSNVGAFAAIFCGFMAGRELGAKE